MKTSELIPLQNFFAETLKETLEDWPHTQIEIAKATRIPAPHLSAMKSGERRCTPEYDLRLGRYFNTSPGFWMRLQLDYEMELTKQTKGKSIESEVTPNQPI